MICEIRYLKCILLYRFNLNSYLSLIDTTQSIYAFMMPMLLLDGGEEQAARALCLNRPDDIMFIFAALREAPLPNAHLLCDRTINWERTHQNQKNTVRMP